MNSRFGLILIIPLFSACSFFSETADIILRFPDNIPASEAALSVSWRVVYPVSATDGIPVYAELLTECGCVEASLSIARGINLPVLSYPVFSLDGGGIRTGDFPAAAFYPLDLDESGDLPLSWDSGAVAEIIRCCSQNSPLYRGFDTARFREAVALKSGEGGNPWMIDPEPVICRLGYGVFRESAITTVEVMEFQVPSLGGSYVSDNPFQPVIEAASDGLLRVIVPLNRKTVFFSLCRDEIISLYFNDALWCWSNSSTGDGESGRR